MSNQLAARIKLSFIVSDHRKTLLTHLLLLGIDSEMISSHLLVQPLPESSFVEQCGICIAAPGSDENSEVSVFGMMGYTMVTISCVENDHSFPLRDRLT